MKQRLIVGGALASFALVVCACQADSAGAAQDPAGAGDIRISEPSSESKGENARPASATDATLRVHLVDAPADEVTAVVVTVAQVEASIGGEWLTVAEGEHTVDLLTLQGGTFLDFGAAKLPAGHVEQVRLRLVEGGDHHVVTPDGASHPLEIPSGEQSGIKLVGGFDLAPCSTTQLTIDFDAKKSISLGNNDQGWRMRPVVRIKALISAGTCEQPLVEDADAGEAGSATQDPCAAVTCTDTEVCENGACRPAE